MGAGIHFAFAGTRIGISRIRIGFVCAPLGVDELFSPKHSTERNSQGDDRTTDRKICAEENDPGGSDYSAASQQPFAFGGRRGMKDIIQIRSRDRAVSRTPGRWTTSSNSGITVTCKSARGIVLTAALC